MEGINQAARQAQEEYLLQLSETMRSKNWQKKPYKLEPWPEPQKRLNTAAKRRRDRLLGNQNMKFVISKATKRIHDRDCPYVSKIVDGDFDMVATFPVRVYWTCDCHKKALIRQGLHPQEAKWIEAYCRIFNAIGAENEDLHKLFIQNGAILRGVTQDSVCLQVNEDQWELVLSGSRCFLYHNSYYACDDGNRVFTADFHLQIQRAIHFRFAVHVICTYNWEDHRQVIMERKISLERQQLRKKLAKVPFCAPYKKRLFSREFWVADLGGQFETTAIQHDIPIRIIQILRYADTDCVKILCRVPKRSVEPFLAMVDDMKEKYVEQRCWEICDFVQKNISG